MSNTTIIQVQQFRFNDGQYRNVEVPTSEITANIDDVLNLVYHYGQNMFQPQDAPSVSVGDVINYDGKYFVVAGFGFTQIKSETYEVLKRACSAACKKNSRYDMELWNMMGEESLEYC